VVKPFWRLRETERAAMATQQRMLKSSRYEKLLRGQVTTGYLTRLFTLRSNLA
jgi:hypothetical protein